jgi:hypothetical protein
MWRNASLSVAHQRFTQAPQKLVAYAVCVSHTAFLLDFGEAALERIHASPVHWCLSSSHDGKARRRRHAAGLDLSYSLLQIDQRHRAL